ncbi:MAG: hypothetical protein KGJ89_02975 [Patescibacteria group bacterium]|nr:hypothetical protein [Patescibacteria group bacterium]MDE2015487.1 hypothetical protein [Patescibacteria group bacterium]MDE2226897.1 hypothetical protein [Patescibacteria group bacterium]
MEKGFRTVQCPGCGYKLQFRISEKHYGTTVTVRCGKCGAKGNVHIPVPPGEHVPKEPEKKPPKGDLFEDTPAGFEFLRDFIFSKEK